MVALVLLLASAGVRADSLVSFRPPPGSTVLAVSVADQQVIREAIYETLASLSDWTGRRARKVAVRVFPTREEFVTFTQVPPDYGAITLDGMILLQPVAMLDRNRGLCQTLAHEAVHHFFFRLGRRWPRDFHEALAHYLSGAAVAESPRAAELAGRERNGAEEVEYEAHLAWVLAPRIEAVGRRAYLRSLLAGTESPDAFRRRPVWYPQR